MQNPKVQMLTKNQSQISFDLIQNFYRSMFVTKADMLIANTKFDGSIEVRFISLQVFFVWATFTLLNLVVLTTNLRIPNDLYYILKCKGTVSFVSYTFENSF